MQNTRQNQKLHWLLPVVYIISALIVSVIISAFLEAGFVSDDFSVLRNYRSTANPFFTGTFFRPETALFFWLINEVFGQQLFWPRVMVFFIHFINAGLVYAIIKHLTNNKVIAFLTGASFLLFYRSVSLFFVFSAVDSALTAFYLASLLVFIIYLDSKKKRYYYLSIIFFVCALLVKEIAVFVPFVLISFEYIFYPRKASGFLKKYIPFFALSFLFITLVFVGDMITGSYYLSKPNYQLGNFEHILKNFANFFIALWPVKFDQAYISENLFVNSLITGLILIGLSIVIFRRKIDKTIRFLIIFIILNLFLPIFFANYQERYLYLVSWSFLALILYLLYRVTLKIKTALSFAILMSFFTSWLSISIYLTCQRFNQWMMVDHTIKKLQGDLVSISPKLNSQEKHIYSVNLPVAINSHVGPYIESYDLFYYLYGPLSSYQEIQDNKLAQKLTSVSPTIPIQGVYVFYYQDGKVVDFSDHYPQIKELILEKFTPKELKNNFNYPYLWDSFKKNQDNQLYYRVTENQIKISYQLTSGGWVTLLNNNLVVLEESQGFSLDIIGDKNQENLSIEFWDIQTNESLKYTQKIDFLGEKTIQVKYDEMRATPKVDRRYVNRLRMTIDSSKAVKGQLILKNFREF